MLYQQAVPAPRDGNDDDTDVFGHSNYNDDYHTDDKVDFFDYSGDDVIDDDATE